jgi:uncharacterized protein (TIGR01777 family)
MHIAITGASGLLGRALTPALEEAGHRVSRVVRPQSTPVPGALRWDPASGDLGEGFDGVDAVVHLAGRSIGDRRWTAAEKQLIFDSRVPATRLLSESLAALPDPPKVLVGASAIGFYGDRDDEELTEASGPGSSFFADVCREWEDATAPAAAAGIRVANLRTGIVLSPSGGALGRLLAPFGPSWLSPYRWGLGGWVGDGRQWWSWISLEDQIRAIRHVLESELSGPLNLTAPNPVTNKQFMKAVGTALRRPVLLPIPRFVFKAVLGAELAEATLFDSLRVVPEVLLGDGFEFRHTDVAGALREAIGT